MRFVFLFLMIFSIMPGFAGVKEKSGTSHGKRGDAKTPLVEYVGVVCPDTAKMFYWKISRRFYPVLNHRYLLRCRGMYVFLPIRCR